MGFLAKFATVLGKVTQIAMGIGPMFGSVVPSAAGAIQTVSHDLEQIATIVQMVESMGATLGNTPGALKLTAASPLVAQIILKSSVLANRKIADSAKFTQGVNSIASGVADVLSSLEDHVPTIDKA